MIAWLLTTTLGRGLAGGVLLLLLAGGGWWYISHLRAQNQALQDQVRQKERAAEIYRHDREVDRDTQTQQDRLDRAGPDELNAEFERLRRKARGGQD
jgi:hypothetical protein